MRVSISKSQGSQLDNPNNNNTGNESTAPTGTALRKIFKVRNHVSNNLSTSPLSGAKITTRLR